MKKRLLTITLATFIVIGCTVVWHSSRPDNYIYYFYTG